jgi:hypothetical protein
MRRAPITILAALLALLLLAPSAQAASQLRHFQGDLSQVGAPPRDGGQIGFDVVFKNKRGAKRKFTPRQVVSVATEKVPLSCTNSPGQGGAEVILTTTIQTQVKVTKQPPPVARKPKANRYSFQFATGFSGFTGTFSGKIFKRGGRGRVVANGILRIEKLDFPGGPTNCSSSGPRGWSAFTT